MFWLGQYLFPGEWWGCAPVTLDASSVVPKERCARLNLCLLLQTSEITPSHTIPSWPWPLSLRYTTAQHSIHRTSSIFSCSYQFILFPFLQILVIGLKPSLKVWITFPYTKVRIYLYLPTCAEGSPHMGLDLHKSALLLIFLASASWIKFNTEHYQTLCLTWFCCGNTDRWAKPISQIKCN